MGEGEGTVKENGWMDDGLTNGLSVFENAVNEHG